MRLELLEYQSLEIIITVGSGLRGGGALRVKCLHHLRREVGSILVPVYDPHGMRTGIFLIHNDFLENPGAVRKLLPEETDISVSSLGDQ